MLVILFKLIRFYLTSSRLLIVFAVMSALFAGITSVVLIIIINQALNSDSTDLAQKLTFAGLVVIQLAAMTASGLFATHLAERTAFDLRCRLAAGVLEMPLQQMEKIGSNTLLAVLTQDILNISNACVQVPQLSASLCVLTVSLAYLATLSKAMFGYLILGLILAILSVRLMEVQAGRRLAKSREVWDSLVEDFHSVSDGCKNLKLNRSRRITFLRDVLARTAGSLRDHNIGAGSIYAVISSWAMVLYFILIGLILFGFPSLESTSNRTILVSYAITVLFMRSYVVALMVLLPQYAQAGTSLRKLEGLSLALRKHMQSEQPAASELEETAVTAKAQFQELELHEVTHRYSTEDQEGDFCLGPINMTLRPGEVVFVTGNNGSGKTTLIKLLAGLYALETGEVLLNGEPATDGKCDQYRQNFSVVFTDSLVIRKLLEIEYRDDGSAFTGLLTKLRLAHKIRQQNGKLHDINLSFGQNRRLALLTALHENRSVYVFDEWESGQDPFFKKVFFTEIVPELKHLGKAVVVVTHEDRYMDVADRVIRLDFGRIESETVVRKNPVPVT